MSPENFCYWLRGYIELNSENNPGLSLSTDQLKKVSEHLSLVLWEVVPNNPERYEECSRARPSCSAPNLPIPKNPERYEECKGFGTVYLTDPPSSNFICDVKNRNFRVHEDQNPVEFPLQIYPNFRCVLSC